MTLIVGVKCKDGIVLAADGAATYATPLGQPTIAQPTSKLCAIGQNVILGVSGPIGLGQSYRDEIEAIIRARNFKAPWKSVQEARQALKSCFWKHAESAWASANLAAQSLGQAALSGAIHNSIVAFPVGNDCELVQFDHVCAPENATNNLPFVAIGAGQHVADPFLAFLRRVFWPNSLPTLSDGTFAAVWTLRHAIDAMPGGVGDPIQVMTLSEDNKGEWKSLEISSDGLGEHFQMIQAVEAEMRNATRRTLASVVEEPIPE